MLIFRFENQREFRGFLRLRVVSSTNSGSILMAGFNPFRKFRVYQKYALAALGILAIFSFIIIPSFMGSFGRSGNEQASLVAKCRRFGNVDQQMLAALREQQNTRRSFYIGLIREVINQDGIDQYTAFQMSQIPNILAPVLEDEQLVQQWVLTQYAKDKGFVVTDNLVVDYLKMVTSNMITNNTFSDVCKGMRISEAHLANLIKDELLIHTIMKVFQSSIEPVTPLTRWEYFQRLNRSVEVEVAAIPVAQFTSKVQAPSKKELQIFFDENKDRIYTPSLPESGFAVPAKVAFQVIDTKPSEELLASITQEEIEQFYETNKSTLFLRQQPGSFGQPSGGGLQGLPSLGGLGGLGGAGQSIFPGTQNRSTPAGQGLPSLGNRFGTDFDFSTIVPDDLNVPTPGTQTETPDAPAQPLPAEATPSDSTTESAAPESTTPATSAPESSENTSLDRAATYKNAVLRLIPEDEEAAPAEQPAPAPVQEEAAPAEEKAPAPVQEEVAPAEEKAPAPVQEEVAP
ncbi:MAG: SurA N-terminal domain-containing protein, partial [Thermoguttaceae bacterium]